MNISNIIITALSFLTISCSTVLYSPPKQGPTANISFSNISLGSGTISITDNCKQFSVDQSLIRSKLPSERSYFTLKIPANKPLTFDLDYYWYSDKNNQLTTTLNVGSGLGIYHIVKPKLSSELLHCSKNITFIPDENKTYNIYFGLDKKSCGINVSETQYNDPTNKNKLLEVNEVKHPQC